MKFVVTRSEVAALIRRIQNIVPQTPPLPILSHVLVEAKDGELIFTATDLTVSTRCTAKAKVSKAGALSIPSKRFFQLVRELEEGDLEVTTEEHEMAEIRIGSSHFRLHGLNKDEYPALPDLGEALQVTLSSEMLKELFFRTAFAVAKEDNRYVLTGLLMRIEKSKAICVGTDGKRLAKVEIPVQTPEDFKGDYILPLKAVDEMMKVAAECEQVTLFLGEDKVALEAGNTLLVTRLLAGNFPDFQQVIATKGGVSVLLHREELIVLLRQIALFTEEKSCSARFTFLPGELILTANTAEVGDGKVSMPVNYSGKKLEIAFNPFYVLDVLKHTKDETVTLTLSDSYNPGMVTDSTSALFVIMPMRIDF